MLSNGKINCLDCEKPLTYLKGWKAGAMFCKNLKCNFVMYFLRGGGSFRSSTKKIEVHMELFHKKDPVLYRPAYSWVEVQKIRITRWVEYKIFFPVRNRFLIFKMKRMYKHTNPELYKQICRMANINKKARK